MSKIRIDLSATVINGQALTFKAPADCSEIEGLIVYYPEGDSTISKTFQFADAHGNNVGNIHLFAENVLVKVLLDTDLKRAYVQNADTNAYLEGKFDERLVAPAPTVDDEGKVLYVDGGAARWGNRSGIQKASGYWIDPGTITCGFRPDVVFISEYDETGLEAEDYYSTPARIWCTEHPWRGDDGATLLVATDTGFIVTNDGDQIFNATDNIYHFLAVKFG